jgi:predicted small lipoprotein YifL
MRNIFQLVAISLLLAIGLHGCGLRGDLYLPEDKAGNADTPASTEVLENPPGAEDVQGFSADPEDDDDPENETPDEQIYPDTGAPALP